MKQSDEEFINQDMVCEVCGWKGKLGNMKLSKHRGGMVDCPKCGSPETHPFDHDPRDVEMPPDWVNPVPKSERN